MPIISTTGRRSHTAAVRLIQQGNEQPMSNSASSDCCQRWYRFSRALAASDEGFWEWDLMADQVWGSQRWTAITGLPETSSTLAPWMERIHPHDQPRFEAELRAVSAGEARSLHNEHRIRLEGGAWRWVVARALATSDSAGGVTHITGSLADHMETRLSDPLTGLPNRIFFLDHLERRLERARLLGDWNFAVLALSLDRFARVNETLGLSGGDRLLLQTGARLQHLLPESSVAARLSGPEFFICLESVHCETDAVDFAGEAAQSLRQPFFWRGHSVTPQFAIGIVKADPACAHPDELIGNAESALAHALRDEPSGIACYTSGMREDALERLEMEAELTHAIHNDGLVMFYQPEVDLGSGRIIGFEALVRWRHPRKGLLPPGAFIPLAEETGLILPLGDWGMREACRQLVAWRGGDQEELRSTRISVNLSARQFEQPDLIDRVRSVLGETGAGPESLRLEVTESSLIADAVSAQKTMRELAGLGIGLHMDDFGIGYSSLHYLQRFPFDTLKIDRSFVQHIVQDRESRQIVRSILDLARSFGMDAVAEGVEDADQLSELRSLGCPCGQGYYFGRPMAPADIEAQLSAGKLASLQPSAV